MPTRVSLLFTLTTVVTDPTAAAVHTAGWSEAWWQAGEPSNLPLLVRELALKRAAMLPNSSAIIGYRTAVYTIVQNKLRPGGSSTAKFLFPGTGSTAPDMPQVALQMSGNAVGAPNKSKFALRGFPDATMVGGEYQPSPGAKTRVTQFCNQLVQGQWGFVGRNLINSSSRVLSIIGGTMVTDGPFGVGAGDYVRLRRVFDDQGRPVKGTFRVLTVAGGNTYTLAGFPAVTVGNSGTVRLDQVNFLQFESVTPNRAVVRKVGRPFESYRGRGSKRTA